MGLGSGIRDPDPRSGIRKKNLPDPGSGSASNTDRSKSWVTDQAQAHGSRSSIFFLCSCPLEWYGGEESITYLAPVVGWYVVVEHHQQEEGYTPACSKILPAKKNNTISVSFREYWMIYRGPCFLVVVWFGKGWGKEPNQSLILYKSCNTVLSGLIKGTCTEQSHLLNIRAT